MPSFEDMGLVANVCAFILGAAIVWRAGFKLSHYADVISVKTGIGHALLGVLLLGGVTSLPEIAVTATAAYGGNTALATSNILGGVAMQVAILAMADIALGRQALTSVVPDAVVLLQGALNIVLLAVVACAAIIGDMAFGGIGLFSWGVFGLFVIAIWLLTKADRRRPWQASYTENIASTRTEGSSSDSHDETLPEVCAKAALAGSLILIAGFVVARSAEVIANETGLGQSFVGVALVAIATSLPEVSTVLAAIRAKLITLAISDILGTNLFDIGLLFVVDALDGPAASFNSVGKFSAVAALLGLLVTALFLVGLLERRDKTILRVGIDSAAVLITYVGGMALLFTLR